MTRIIFSLALAASTAACATILDFQEPTDRVTATDGVTAAEGGSSTPATTSAPIETRSDAGVEAAPDVEPKHELPAEPVKVTTPCVCAPSIDEWRGPFAVAVAGGAEPPACAGSFGTEAYVGHSEPAASPAVCSCACDAPTGVTCGVVTTRFYADKACSGEVCAIESGALSCGAADCALNKKSRSVGFESTPAGGTCAPRAQVRIPPVDYKESIRLCAGPTATCDAGACEVPSAGFSMSNRCVQRPGEYACPTAYPVRTVFHSGGNDTRSCSACSCGGASGAACHAAVTTSTALLCTVTEPAAAGSGLDITAATKVSIVGAATPAGGSCPPSGGAPTGGFKAEGPSTVCCLE